MQTSNAGGNVELVDDGVHDDAEIVVRGGCKETQKKNQNNGPKEREPHARSRATTVLEVTSRHGRRHGRTDS